MIRWILSVALFLVVSVSAQATLPTTIHRDSTYLKVNSENSAVISRSRSWTVYSSEYIHHGLVLIYEDGNDKVTNIHLKVYKSDPSGLKLIEELGIKDFRKYGVGEGMGITDAEAFVYDPSNLTPPFKMELEYTLKQKQFINFSDWQPLEDHEHVVAKASLCIESGYPNQVRIKVINPQSLEYIKTDQHQLWKTTDHLTVKAPEMFGKDPLDHVPKILLAPSSYKVKSFTGTLDTWSNFGRWNASLQEGRQELSSVTKENLKNEFGSIADKKERCKAVYEWMQSRTRYVSIQLGIGGWQPERADRVDELGYGDCKALSNYLVAALKSVDIAADYCLVYLSENEDKVDPEFPSNRFNHAIVCVPVEEDTIWLECTSQTLPFNLIHSGIAGHYALVIHGENSELVKIPDPIDNVRRVNIVSQMELQDPAFSIISSEITFSGLLYEEAMYMSHLSSTDLNDQINLFLTDHDRISKKVTGNAMLNGDSTVIRFTYQDSKCVSLAGSYVFIDPAMTSPLLPSLPFTESRETDIEILSKYELSYRVDLKIPEHLSIEQVPEQITKESEFGAYSVGYRLAGDHISIMGNFTLSSGKFQAEQYSEMRNYILEFKNLAGRDITLRKS